MKKRTFLQNSWHGITRKAGSLFNNSYRETGIGWFKLKYYKHLPPGPVRKHKILGHWLYFISPPELLYGLKEIFIDKIYLQELKANATVIDCGANIGLSVIYIKSICPSARITAFEPDENNFKLLEKNTASYGLNDVVLKQEAVWTENTEIGFASESSMSSKIETTNAGTRKVKAIRLRDHLDKKVDFLKIDIEGAEYEVLKDIEDRLSNVGNLFIEYHGQFSQSGELTHIYQMLDKNGFSYYIREAAPVYPHPFKRENVTANGFDVQLNIFCFRAS